MHITIGNRREEVCEALLVLPPAFLFVFRVTLIVYALVASSTRARVPLKNWRTLARVHMACRRVGTVCVLPNRSCVLLVGLEYNLEWLTLFLVSMYIKHQPRCCCVINVQHLYA